jgi:hypothetical protein
MLRGTLGSSACGAPRLDFFDFLPCFFPPFFFRVPGNERTNDRFVITARRVCFSSLMSATLDTLQFGLCRDMLAVVDVVAQFDVSRVPAAWLAATRRLGALTLTGEGSSRIFPSKQAMRIANQRALSIVVRSVGGCEAALYTAMLKKTAVLGMSNSGRTVSLFCLAIFVVYLFGFVRPRLLDCFACCVSARRTLRCSLSPHSTAVHSSTTCDQKSMSSFFFFFC